MLGKKFSVAIKHHKFYPKSRRKICFFSTVTDKYLVRKYYLDLVS